MTDEIWKRAEIESPCIKLCVIHPDSRTCVGCFRTIDEISAWSRLSVDQRRDITAALPARAAEMTKRRGGRQARLSAASPDKPAP